MSTGYNMQKAKRGAILLDKGKTRITIYIDDDVLDAYRHLSEGLSNPDKRDTS